MAIDSWLNLPIQNGDFPYVSVLDGTHIMGSSYSTADDQWFASKLLRGWDCLGPKTQDSRKSYG